MQKESSKRSAGYSGDADLKGLASRIGYQFRDMELLRTAVTHSSFANENKGSGVCNERLEFLGDSVLGFVTAEYLFQHFPDLVVIT